MTIHVRWGGPGSSGRGLLDDKAPGVRDKEGLVPGLVTGIVCVGGSKGSGAIATDIVLLVIMVLSCSTVMQFGQRCWGGFP